MRFRKLLKYLHEVETIVISYQGDLHMYTLRYDRATMTRYYGDLYVRHISVNDTIYGSELYITLEEVKINE